MDRKAVIGGMVGTLLILGVLAVIGIGMETYRGHKAEKEAQARVEATAVMQAQTEDARQQFEDKYPDTERRRGRILYTADGEMPDETGCIFAVMTNATMSELSELNPDRVEATQVYWDEELGLCVSLTEMVNPPSNTKDCVAGGWTWHREKKCIYYLPD